MNFSFFEIEMDSKFINLLNNIKLVKSLYVNNENMEMRFNYAIENNDFESVKIFLENKIHFYQYSFHIAVISGHYETVKLILKNNKPDLENIIDNRRIETVKLLLESNKYCSEKIIDLAAKNGYFETVKILLVNNKPCSKYAINWSAKNGYYKIVKLLSSHGKPYSVQYKSLVEEIVKHEFP